MVTLIEDIQSSIKAAGGRMRLAYAIIQECPDKWFDEGTRRFLKRRSYLADRYERGIRKETHYWSNDEKADLIRLFGTMPVARVARILGRTRKAVTRKFYLIATPEQIEALPVLKSGEKYGKEKNRN